MPAQYVKAYVKRNKNDAADAAAICEAVMRRGTPTGTVIAMPCSIEPVSTRAGRLRCSGRTWQRTTERESLLATLAFPNSSISSEADGDRSLERAPLRRVGPLGDLALEKLAELFGRPGDEAVAERDAFLLHVRQRQNT